MWKKRKFVQIKESVNVEESMVKVTALKDTMSCLCNTGLDIPQNSWSPKRGPAIGILIFCIRGCQIAVTVLSSPGYKRK